MGGAVQTELFVIGPQQPIVVGKWGAVQAELGIVGAVQAELLFACGVVSVPKSSSA